MSPQKRKKLSKIRSELDKIDNSLIKIIKKRTFLVKKVLELKDRKNQIVDQKRINEILNKLDTEAKKRGVPQKLVRDLWKSMIKSFILYEEQIFDKTHK